MFRDADDVYAWLSGFINLERARSDIHYKLDRMRLLAEIAGHPEEAVPSVHIAGSKGKGSLCVMIASILEAAGIPSARYLSPHVSDFRERCSQPLGPFPETIYAAAGEELRALVQRYRSSTLSAAIPKGSPSEPTFFELATLFYFLCCRQAKIKAGVVEVGLGGRLDATNILTPLLAVIMPIELEHTDILGSTIKAIAGEKAGIIKRGVPCLCAEQTPEALTRIRRFAREKESSFHYFPKEARLENIQVDTEGTEAFIVFPNKKLFARPLHFRLRLIGEIQAANAAIAALAVRLAFPYIDDRAISAGLAAAELPARFQRLRNNPPLIVDGAHTPRSFQLCVTLFTRLYGRGGVLLFACAADKAVTAMAAAAATAFSRVFVTSPGSFKASDPEKAFQVFTAMGIEASLISDTSAAVAESIKTAEEERLPLLAAGSFYLSAIVIKAVKGNSN